MTAPVRLSQSSNTTGAGEYSKSIICSPASWPCGGVGSSRLSRGDGTGGGIKGDVEGPNGDWEAESGEGRPVGGNGWEGTSMVLRKGAEKGLCCDGSGEGIID